MLAIDVHTHVVPALIREEPNRDSLWPSVHPSTGGKATVVIAGKPFRIVDSRCWDVKRRLADMEHEGISRQVLSPMPELLSHWLAARDTDYLADMVNESIAAMIGQEPGRFLGLGMIAAQDDALARAGLRKIARLGLSGIEIGTHINGTPLGDEKLWALYEEAEALDLAIFVHPLHPCGLERIGDPDIGIAASFPLEIAMAALSLMGGGVLSRFPRLRFLLSHGGGALTSVLGRLEMTRKLLPAIDKALGGDAWELARRFWFDSNVYDHETLKQLADRMGHDRLVVGSDYPFLIRQPFPGQFAEDAIAGAVNQCCSNARALMKF